MKSSPILKLIDTLSARTRFGELLERIETEKIRFLVTKRGKPKVVILSIDDYLKNMEKGSKIKDMKLEIPLEDFLKGQTKKPS